MRLIGPHVSIAGDISLAVERAHELGATGFAIFTKNQRIWKCKEMEKSSASAFIENMKKYGYTPGCVLPHASYLINMATPDPELRKKSMDLMFEEIRRVEMLDLKYLNIHPGAYKEGNIEDGLKRISSFLDEVLENTDVIVSLENTAGSGTVTGSKMEELDSIISGCRHKDKLGITIDTMHAFGAGYDVRGDMSGFMQSVVDRFGEDKLIGMHINDSKVELASHRDRHDSIGKGLIGYDAFKELVRLPFIDNRPLVLETPDETRWKSEIETLLLA